MPPKPWSKLRPKGRGLLNKEHCPPSSSIRTKSSATADDDRQDTLKNILSEDQDEALCSGKTGRTIPQTVWYFQEKFLWTWIFPYLEKHFKKKKALTEVSAPRDQQQPPTKMGAHCMYPLHQNHICTGLPCLPLGNTWEAISHVVILGKLE